MTHVKSLLCFISLSFSNVCLSDDRVVTIAASTSGGLHAKSVWFLSMNSAGDAQLTVGYTNPVKKEFRITDEQVDSLLELIDRVNAFDLPAEYGESAPDDVVRSLVVVVDKRVLRFVFYSFPDHASVKPKDLESACLISHKIRGWLDGLQGLPEMLDYRQYELDALTRLSGQKQIQSKTEP